MGIEGGNGACGHRLSGVHQHIQPFAEAIGIELFVASRASRLRMAPQIEVEEGRELRGRGRGDEVAARLEAAVLNELMQRLRCEVRDDPRQAWRVQETREPTVHRAPVARRHSAVRDYCHGPAMIPVLRANKQSTNAPVVRRQMRGSNFPCAVLRGGSSDPMAASADPPRPRVTAVSLMCSHSERVLTRPRAHARDWPAHVARSPLGLLCAGPG